MRKNLIFKLFVCLFVSLMASSAFAQDGSILGMPALTSSVGENGEATYSLSLQILVLMTVLTLVPSIVLGMTAFTRVIIVLSILRQALGTQQTPPNQVLIAIALFITFYVMSPIFEILYETALNPYLEGTTSAQVALSIATDLLKEFMVANTRSSTMNMFAEMAGEGPFEDTQAIPLSIVLPSFITSELKTAFEIGFLIFMPFLVIDFVIASILMSFGMMMLSPMLISLPFKLLLFVLVDGWAMTIGSLSSTFVVGLDNMIFDQNVQYLSMAFWQIIVVAGPILLVALAVGLFIGLIQAATSINEMTLSFVPKLFIVLLTLSLMATFIFSQMTDYFAYIFDEISRKGL